MNIDNLVKTETEKSPMSQNNFATQVTKINAILKKGEPSNWTKDHKGYSGYKPQSIIDAINAVIGGEWSLEVLDNSYFQSDKTDKNGNKIKHAMVKVRLRVFGKSVDAFASHPVLDDPGDAFKSAQTDAMKKAFSHFSIGNRAYHGLLVDKK